MNSNLLQFKSHLSWKKKKQRLETMEKATCSNNTGNQDFFACMGSEQTVRYLKQKHKWPESVISKMELMYLNAPFPAEGKSDVEGIFDPPYYEWFQYNLDQTEFKNLDKSLTHIENFMLKHGPFDGLLGFSQGAFISGALPGLQDKGLALTNVPKIKYLIIIGGGKCLPPALSQNAYSLPIEVPSLHLLGDRDYMKPQGMKLLESFVDPIVIHHRRGHTVPRGPRLENKDMEIMISFLERITCQTCAL